MRTLSVFSQIRALTGLSAHSDTWLESKRSRDVLDAQTRNIAVALGANGYNCFRETRNDLVMVGMVTGSVEKVLPLRNLNILPSVASANRSQLLKQMDFFAETSSLHLRFARITNGARCGIEDLRERIKGLSREISNYSAESAMKAWGVSVVMRATEVTVKRDDENRVTCHPHAHCVFAFARKLSTHEFRDWLRWSHDYFTGVWRDCGRVVNSAEILKYPTKPADLECLTSAELVEFARAMEGVKLTSPMGDLRELRKALDDEGVKLGKTKQSDQEVWEWCKVARSTRKKRVSEFSDETTDAVEDVNGLNDGNMELRNHVLAVLSPSPRFGPRFEPVMLVAGYTGNLVALLATARMDEIAAEAAGLWLSRAAESDVKVPTSTISAPDDDDEFLCVASAMKPGDPSG